MDTEVTPATMEGDGGGGGPVIDGEGLTSLITR